MNDFSGDSQMQGHNHVRMDHPDEHTLELYVLGARETEGSRKKIESHLRNCAGCRDLVDRASAFYADLSAETEQWQDLKPAASESLPVRREMASIFRSPLADAPLWPIPRGSSLRRFVRTHPVVSAGSGFAVVCGVALAAATLVRPSFREPNVTQVIENRYESRLEAYSAAGARLWTIPVPHLATYMAEEDALHKSFVEFADLDGDGLNEVVADLPMNTEEAVARNVIHVFGADRAERFAIRVGEAVKYRERIYPDEFCVSGFTVLKPQGSRTDEIVVAASHLHSPFIVYRYDAHGNKLGSYRHFGQLKMMTPPLVTADGRSLVILTGVTDRDDDRPAAVIIGLDPSRIAGDAESSFSGGFNLPVSSAELFYVHVPQSTVARELGEPVSLSAARVARLPGGVNGFSVNVVSSATSGPLYLEYIFRPDFTIVEVKSANSTRAVFDTLKQRGVVSGGFYDDYLRTVAGDVRYWDGASWQASAAPVRH
ncbi:MAG TPA: hypothetical protein VL221_13690 [Bacteroidota bacterium]|nr:hypothetical protein [Bacteroidota bacterium]